MTKSVAKKKTPLKVVVIILAVVVVLVFVMAGNAIYSNAKGSTYDYDARDYIYSAEHGQYGQLYDTAIHDMDKEKEYKSEVEEYRALAFYYEQAFLEHAYRTAGDIDKASSFAERMREYESELGSMSSKVKNVQEAIGE